MSGGVQPTLRKPGLFAGLIPVVARNLAGNFNASGNLSDGVQTALTTRMRFTVTQDSNEIRLVYSNFTGITDNPDTINVKASLETPSGTKYPVSFGGKRTVQIDGGCVAVSDPVGVDLVAAAAVYVRTFVTVVSGKKYPLGQLLFSSISEGDNSVEGTAASDLTDTGTVPSKNVYAYGPSAVLGYAATPLPSLAIVGDSIADGTGDTSAPERGFIPRALNATRAWIKVCIASEQATDFASITKRRGRMAFIAGCSSAICQYGINDCDSSRTLAQLQADLITIWTAISARGVKVWQTTITPKSSSSDSWATLGNQTSFSGNTVRVNTNNWIRDGAPILNGAAVATGSSAAGTLRAGMVGHPLTGYFEVADTVESSRDSGKWKSPSYTADGVHPSATGAAAAAAAVTTASLA